MLTQIIPGSLSFPPWWTVFFQDYFKTQIRTRAMVFLKSSFSLLLPLSTRERKGHGQGTSFNFWSMSWLSQPCCSMARTTDDTLNRFSRLGDQLANSWVFLTESHGRWAVKLFMLVGWLPECFYSLSWVYDFWSHSCKPELQLVVWSTLKKREEWSHSFICVCGDSVICLHYTLGTLHVQLVFKCQTTFLWVQSQALLMKISGYSIVYIITTINTLIVI